VIVLSLFDGISCARVALTRLGYTNIKYYASEVDKYAIQIAQKNFPDTIQLGDVRNITASMFDEPIDLLIGGSPCQDLSIAKNNRKGLDGERSGLFWEYVRIWKELKPKYFVLENVGSMHKREQDKITEVMGVNPILINASLVSAQNRKRLFWTNILVSELPQDRGILLKDITIDGGDCSYSLYNDRFTHNKSTTLGSNSHCIAAKTGQGLVFIGGIGNKDWIKDGKQHSRNYPQGNRVYSENGKATTLSANGGGMGAKTGLYQINSDIRKLMPIECERLQSLPDNYTEGISNTQRYKCLGNAFNVEVVRHILSYMEVDL
jgi:DNA (cytosine-5)-methyltransferase 3A